MSRAVGLSLPFKTHIGFVRNHGSAELPHAGLMVPAGFLVIFRQVFVMLAFRLAAPLAVAPFYYTFLLWAVICGYVIFGEIPNALAICGMVLIAASGVAVVLLENRRAAVAVTLAQ